MNKNLIQRTIAGGVLVALILCSIIFSPYGFVALFGLVAALSVAEFHKLTNKNGINVPIWWAILASELLFGAFFLYFSGIISPLFHQLAFIAYAFCLFGLFMLALFKPIQMPIEMLAHFVLGQIYVAVPLSLLSGILFFGGNWSPILLVALFVTIWMNDTCAYLVGSAFGKHRLFERVSPKKSWEGFFGGVVGALLSGFLFYKFSAFGQPLWFWLIFAEIVVVFGTLGDLIESLFKRSLGVKDSGNIIPGHGGMLDRFDSLLMSSPFVFLFLYILINFIS